MNTTINNINMAMGLAEADKETRVALREWYRRDRRTGVGAKYASYREWLRHMADCMVTSLHEDRYVSAENMAEALRIAAVGVPLARKAAETAAQMGVEMEECSGLEEGMVNVSLCFCGRRGAEAAGEAAEMFRAAGYSCELMPDDERDGTFMFGNIDFDKYLAGENAA